MFLLFFASLLCLHNSFGSFDWNLTKAGLLLLSSPWMMIEVLCFNGIFAKQSSIL